MTDFFAQLAARYRGEAGTLRPRVPFRFEPVSPSLAAAALTGPAAAGPAEAGLGRPGPGARRGSRRGLLAEDAVAADPHGAAPAADPARNRAGGRGGTRPGSGPALPDRPGAALLAPGARRPARQDPAATWPVPSPAGPPGHAAPGGALLPGQDALLTGAAAVRSGTATARRGTATARRGTAAREPEPAALRPLPASRRAARPAAAEPKAASAAVPRTADDPGEPAAGPGQDARRRPPGRAGREPGVLAPEAGRRQARGYIAAGPSGPAQESITVQVTIGRVEVRAAGPAPAPRARERPAAGPSLADYLRDRSRSAGAAS